MENTSNTFHVDKAHNPATGYFLSLDSQKPQHLKDLLNKYTPSIVQSTDIHVDIFINSTEVL